MAYGCAGGTIQLPEYTEQFGVTDLPAWVSAGGKALFEQAAELASSDIAPSNIPMIASYGPDGNLLTEEEQMAAKMLTEGATSYQPFLDQAANIAGTLGQGYDSMSQQELLGTPFQGMSQQELMGDYQGATRDELLGGGFNMETAQPFLDIYQQAQDASVRELQDQIAQQQSQARASAARGGGGFGSRLGILEATLGAEGAQGAADLRARAAAEGLGFAANRFDADRGARFQAEDLMRGQFLQDRAGRFDIDASRRAQFDADRAARFQAEDAARTGYETGEASRLRQLQSVQALAPLTHSLQEAAAQGLITTGEARRRLDQAVIEMAKAEDIAKTQLPFDRLNFALGALQGVPYGQTTYGYRLGTTTQQQPNLFGQVLGAGGALGAAYLKGMGT